MANKTFLDKLIRPVEIVMDLFTRIGLGELSNHRRIALYGNNSDIDTAAAEDVWSGGGLYPWMTAATSLEIVSDSTADTAAGTGARTVTISGLDASYNEISATVTLNGTTAAAISTQFYRINGASVLTAGSGAKNAGTLTIRDASAGTTRAVIQPGIGTLRQAVYTVPAGYKLCIGSVLVSINRTDTSDRWATAASWVRGPSGVETMPAEIGFSSAAPYRDRYDVPAMIPEKFDTAIRITQVSGNNTDITANIMGFLKPIAE